MTIAKLVVEVEGRTRSLEDAMNKASRLATAFQRDMNKSLSLDSAFSGVSDTKLRAISKAFGDIKREAKSSLTSIRQQFEGGFIDERKAIAQVDRVMSQMVAKGHQAAGVLGATAGISPDAARALEQTTERVSTALAKSFNTPSDLVQRVTSGLGPLEAAFERESNVIKDKLYAGIGDKSTAARAGGESAAAFNAAWRKEVAQIEKEFHVPASVKQILLSQLKPEGLGFGEAVTEQQRAVQEAARQIAALQDNLKTTLSRNKLDLSEKLIDPQEFNTRGQLAMDEFKRGIAASRVDLKSKGLLTGEVEQGLSASLERAQTVVNRATAKIADQGSLAARGYVQQFQRDYRIALADAQNALGQGVIGPRAFKAIERDAKIGLNASLTAAMQSINDLSPEATGIFARAFKKVQPIGPNVKDAMNLDDLERQLTTAQSRLAQRLAASSNDLATSLIKPAEFRKAAADAMTLTTQEIARGRAKVQAAQGGTLTADQEALFAASFKAVKRATNRVLDEATRDSVRAAREASQAFVDTYNRTIAQAKLQSTQGKLSTKEFTATANEARKTFNESLDKLRNDMEAKGILTPEAARFIDKQYQKAGDTAAKTFSTSFAKGAEAAGQSLTTFGTKLTQRLTAPLLAAGGASIKFAADFEAAGTRLDLVFGPAANRVRQELARMQSTVPATSIEIQNFATRVGEVFIPLGGATKELDKFTGKIKDVPTGMEEGLRVVGDMSKEIIKLTKNLVILNPGVSAERAFNAIINATVGRTTELKKLGVVVNQQIINETAYREGIARTGATLTASQNAQAAYLAIMQRSSLIESAVARSRNTFNLSLEFTKKAFIEAAIAIGREFLPAAKSALDAARALAIGFQRLSPSTLGTIAAFAKFILIIGPLLVGLGVLISTIGKLAAAFRALAIAARFGSIIGFVSAIGKLLGPIGAIVAVLATLVGGWYAYKKATDAATEANASFAISLEALSEAQLTAQLQQMLLESSRLTQQRQAFERAANERALAEAREKNKVVFGEGAPQQIKPNPIFTEKEQERVSDIDAKMGDLKSKIASVSAQLDKSASGFDENSKFMQNYREEFEKFQKMAREDSMKEQLRKENEEWRTLNLNVNAAISSLRVSRRLGEDLAEPLRRVRDLLDEVQIKRTELDVAPARDAQLESLANKLELAAAGPKTSDKNKPLEQLALDTRVAVGELNRARKASEDLTIPLAKVDSLAEIIGSRMRDVGVDPKTLATLTLMKQALDNAAQSVENERFKNAWKLFTLDVRVAIAALNDASRAGKGIEEPLARVNALIEEISKRKTRFGVDKSILDQLELLRLRLEAAAQAAERVDISGLTSRVALDLDTLKNLTEQMTDVSTAKRADSFSELLSASDKLRRDEAEILDMLIRQVGTVVQRNKLQRDLIDIENQQKKAAEKLFPATDTFLPGLEEKLEQLGAVLRDRKLDLDIQLRIPRNDEAIRNAKAAISAIQEQIGLSIQDSLKTGLFKFADQATQAEVLKGLDDILKRLGIDSQTFNESLEHTDRILTRLAIGARGLSELFDVFDAKEMSQFAKSAFNALEAAKQLKAVQRGREDRISAQNPFDPEKKFDTGFNIQEIGAAISGFAGVVGAAFSGIKILNDAIFGLSDTEREHMKIAEENNQRLAEMTLAVEGFNGSVRDQLRVAAALRNPEVSTAAKSLFQGQALEQIGLAKSGSSIEQFNRSVEKFGITFDQINKIAKDNGITLLDSKGRIVAAEFDRLTKAIELNVKLQTQWQNGMGDTVATLDDLRASMDLLNNVMNVEDTPQRALDQALNELATLAPDLFEKFFGGIDLTDVDAVEKALQLMTQAFVENAEGFSKLFGGLLDKSQLTSIIELMAGAFDRLRDSTDKLTESQLNVPTWFKTAQVRFESVDVKVPDVPAGAPSPVKGDGNTVITSNDVNVNAPTTIVVQQRESETDDEFADRIIAAMSRRNFVTTGSNG